MLGQDRQLAEDLRELAVGTVLEGELDLEWRQRLHLGDAGPIERVLRIALGAQDIEAEDDIVGGHGLAVLPTRLGPEVESDPALVLWQVDGLGEKSVLPIPLVR